MSGPKRLGKVSRLISHCSSGIFVNSGTFQKRNLRSTSSPTTTRRNSRPLQYRDSLPKITDCPRFQGEYPSPGNCTQRNLILSGGVNSVMRLAPFIVAVTLDILGRKKKKKANFCHLVPKFCFINIFSFPRLYGKLLSDGKKKIEPDKAEPNRGAGDQCGRLT